MSEEAPSTISFIIDKADISIFSIILQQGFKVNARVGCSLKNLLCDQFGVSPGYLTDRIQTIFLNGRPVDNVETTIIVDGAVLALSAAMPGLVGATFRSNGPLSSFRSSISHRSEEKKPKTSDQGMVTLKFFNLLVSEMGPIFLERGIWVEKGIMKDFIEEKKVDGQAAFKSIVIDGQKKIWPDQVALANWNDSQKLIHVIVQIEK